MKIDVLLTAWLTRWLYEFFLSFVKSGSFAYINASIAEAVMTAAVTITASSG